MFEDALIIFRKEAGNVFRDKRAVFANYLLPLLLMPIMFGAIAFVQKSQMDSRAETVYRFNLVNPPGEGFEKLLAAELKYAATLERASPDGVTIEFPADYQAGEMGKVRILADSTRQDMKYAAEKAKTAVENFNKQLSAKKLAAAGLGEGDLSPLAIERVDVAAAKAQGSDFLAMMLPYLILIMLFAGSMSIGMAITAGEKDKGTLASLLVNQVSRSSIAIGKSLFLVVSSLISAAANVVGIVAATLFMGLFFGGSMASGASAVPAGQSAGFGGMNFAGALVEPLNLLVFVVSLLCASGLAASVIVFLGTKARNMKEAGGYIMPLYILIIMAGVATMQMDTSSNLALYLIPLVNTVFVIKGAIVATLSPLTVLVSFAVNLAGMVLFAWLTTREFNSERVLYTE